MFWSINFNFVLIPPFSNSSFSLSPPFTRFFHWLTGFHFSGEHFHFFLKFLATNWYSFFFSDLFKLLVSHRNLFCFILQYGKLLLTTCQVCRAYAVLLPSTLLASIFFFFFFFISNMGNCFWQPVKYVILLPSTFLVSKCHASSINFYSIKILLSICVCVPSTFSKIKMPCFFH